MKAIAKNRLTFSSTGRHEPISKKCHSWQCAVWITEMVGQGVAGDRIIPSSPAEEYLDML